MTVDDERRALYGGAVHYWRLDRSRWSPILDEVKRMGFTMVSIYIPWEVHETARGEFSFEGDRDIDAFLTLIEEKDLDIVVRPGPQINSELTWFGYPRRILEDPELQARNGQGTPAVLTQVPRPIPAVSYAADAFYDEVALWYDAICPILAKHAHPHGRIVAAQVDNEMAYFFHVNAYAADFHPASIARYRAFLADKYGGVDALNRTYGTGHGSFDDVEPPRRFGAVTPEDIPFHTDWVAYRERHLVDAMGRLADMLRGRGLDQIALFHNYPHPLGPGGAVSGFTTPFDLAGLEDRLDFVGFDVYSRKQLYDHVKTVLSYVVGTSRYPYIPEFIAGVWPWYLDPADLADEEFVTKAALMQGIKGFSRYMLVERDRWLNSPVRRDGRVREDHAAMFARANAIAVDGGFAEFRREADVLLLANRDYDRLEAASVLVGFPGDFLETPSGFSEYPTFMTVSEAPLGFEEPIQTAKADWFARAYEGLNASGPDVPDLGHRARPRALAPVQGDRGQLVRVHGRGRPAQARRVRDGRRHGRARAAAAVDGRADAARRDAAARGRGERGRAAGRRRDAAPGRRRPDRARRRALAGGARRGPGRARVRPLHAQRPAARRHGPRARARGRAADRLRREPDRGHDPGGGPPHARGRLRPRAVGRPRGRRGRHAPRGAAAVHGQDLRVPALSRRRRGDAA